MTLILKILLVVVLVPVLLAIWGVWNWTRLPNARPAIGTTKTLEHGEITLTYHSAGKGKPAILVPSLGRPASDFNELAQSLNDNGYQTLALEPRGLIDATGTQNKNITLFDLAEDVAAIANKETPANEKIILVGHAFGNRVVRAFGQTYPEKTRAVILLAAGGLVPLNPRTRAALTRVFYFFLPPFLRMPELRYAFFANKNPIPDYWIGGWSIRVSYVQRAAVTNSPTETWWAGGTAPLLVIQAMQDTIAPPGNADALIKEFPNRVTVTEIEQAGHALLPEQPEQISRAVLNFLNKLD